MAAAELAITVKLRNQAESGLRSLGASLAGLGRHTPTLAGVGKAIAGLGTAAAVGATAGVVGLGVGLGAAAKAGLGFNNDMEQARAAINAFTKDSVATEALLAQVEQRAKSTPFAFNEMASAAAGLQPVMRASGASFDELIGKAEILAASNPAEGLTGAVFALKEAAGGDFASIIERFNLPRSYINQLKEEGVPNLEIVSRSMQQLGLDTDLVSNMAETGAGRWSTFLDNMTSIQGIITQPLFDTFSAGLGTVNQLLEDNMPAIEGFAQGLAEGIGGAIDWAVNTGIPNLVNAFNIVRETLAGFASGDFSAIQELITQTFGEDTAAQVVGFFEKIRDIGTEALQKIQDVFGIARDAVATFVQAFSGDWENIPGKIDPIHQVAGELGIAFSTVVDAVLEIARTMGGSDATVSTYSDHLRDTSTNATSMSGALDGVVSALHTFNATISDGAQAVRDFEAAGKPVSDFLNTAMTRGTAVAADAVRGFASAVTTAFGIVKSNVDTAQQNVNTFVAQVQTGMTNIGSSFIRMAATAAVQIALVVAAIRGILTAIGQVAAEAFSRAVSIGTSIVAGIRAGLGDPGGTLASMARSLVTGAINAAKAAAGIQSPSKKAAEEVGKPIAEGVAAGLKDGEAEAVGAAADLIDKIGQALSSITEGLGDIGGATLPGRGVMQGVITFLRDMVSDFGRAALSIMETLESDIAPKLADQASSAMGAITDALDFLQSINDDTQWRAPSRTRLQGLVTLLRDTVADFWHAARDVLYALEDETAPKLADQASSALSALSDALDFLSSIDEDTTWRAPSRGRLNSLVVFMRDTIALFWTEAQTVLEAVESEIVPEFADAVESAISALSDTLQLFEDLDDAGNLDVPAGAMESLKDAIEQAVALMVELAEHFEKDGLDAAVAFAESAGKIIEPISEAVKAFEALQDIESIPPERMEILAANLYQAVWWMQEIAKGMNDEGLKSAVAFSMAVSEVFDAMDTAVEVIEGLRELEGVPPERFEAFAASMYLAVQTMQRVADAAGPMLENAETWRDQMQDLAQAIKDGIEAIESIGEIPAVPSLPGVPDTPSEGSPQAPSGEQPRRPLRPAGTAAASATDWSALSTMTGASSMTTAAAQQPLVINVPVDARGATPGVGAEIKTAVYDAVNRAIGVAADQRART